MQERFARNGRECKRMCQGLRMGMVIKEKKEVRLANSMKTLSRGFDSRFGAFHEDLVLLLGLDESIFENVGIF